MDETDALSIIYEMGLEIDQLRARNAALLAALERIGGDQENNWPTTSQEYMNWWRWAREYARTATVAEKKE